MDGVSRQAKIKNKNPASVQVTAEQILREANERQERPKTKPVVILADADELNEYQQDKRKAFEDAIRANRNVINNWIRYATWEEGQGAYDRARSVLERAIEVDARNPSVWLRYIEMEMKVRNVNSARNVFDRVVSFLPRVDMFWYKYVYMEEILDNVGGARQVFERWMKWQPSEDAWMGYVKFEKRYGEIEKSRVVYKRFVECLPQPKNWIKWAKFEEALSNNEYARKIYEECIDTATGDQIDQNVYVSFAKFETRMKEFERARGIFKFALEKLGQGQSANLYNEYTLFEKMFGDKQGIEDVVMTKRRAKYEQDLELNPRNYDTWFSYIRLEEDTQNHSRIRDIYERAVAQVPLTQEKRFWRRYIYLWLFYACWEESVAQDAVRAKAVYEKAVAVVPHAKFTFAKLWTGYAGLLVRQGGLCDARKVLGMAIGRYAKPKLFKAYISQELALREFDRTRTLYEKYLSFDASVCQTWIKYAELEAVLGENERARGVYSIALEQSELDMPEILWKAGIDFEGGLGECDRVRVLYERLLQKTEHVKVWISYAGYETTTEEGSKDSRTAKSRDLFSRAYTLIKSGDSPQAKPQRMLLLESWKAMESEFGSEVTIAQVDAKMPRVVKKRRKVDGGVWEEYFDYIFPDDEVDKPNFKLLQMAQAWKEKAAREKAEQEMEEMGKKHEEDKDGEQGEDEERSGDEERDGAEDGDAVEEESAEESN